MADPRTKISLEVLDQTGVINRLALSDAPLLIGRVPEAQVRLDRNTVSRRHAEIYLDPFRRWFIRDLGSRNGTRVNGAAVTDHAIHNGDIVGVGEFTLRVLSTGTTHGLLRAPSSSTPANITIAEGVSEISTLHEIESPRISASHLGLINDFGTRMLNVDDARTRLSELCRLMVRPELHGHCAMIMRVDKANPLTPPQTVCGPEYAPRWVGWSPYISKSILRTLAQKQEPLLASNLPSRNMSAELSLSPDVMQLSTLACPIRMDDQAIDALYVVLPPEFGTGEWLALASLACKQWEQAEVAIRARVQQALHQAIERELDQARQIQTRLVPSKLKIPHVDAAIGFKPCKWVGGDYVDVLTTADGRTLLILADVCGKGMPAALVASALHTTVRVGVRSGMPLDQLMRHLNEYLCESEKNVAFVTAVAVLLDPRTGILQCVNAGHPPALLFDPEGTLSPLQTSANLPLGIAPEALEVQESLMPPGHTLALYSDGLTDLQSEDGRRLGTEMLYEKLTELVREHRGTLAPMAEKLTELLDRTQGNTLPADDRTFLLARRLDA